MVCLSLTNLIHICISYFLLFQTITCDFLFDARGGLCIIRGLPLTIDLLFKKKREPCISLKMAKWCFTPMSVMI